MDAPYSLSKVLGFVLGPVFQGLAMGHLLLAAIPMGMQEGDPFGIVGAALALTGLTGFGMTAYVWTGPKEFGLTRSGLSLLFLIIMAFMGLIFVVPSLFGGTLGIILSAVFVAVSTAGLLYQVNQVMHRPSTKQHIEGVYLITMGILILYWNILTLLMRLKRR
jgi:FtsH-binding integral membrane protein